MEKEKGQSHGDVIAAALQSPGTIESRKWDHEKQ
jgi:hypothetical protein